MADYKSITGKILSVEPIQDVEIKGQKHKRWAVMVSTEDGGEMKILVVDWDNTGVCPLKVGETQKVLYKDWTSNQGVTYHNYIAPRKGGNNRSGSQSAPLRISVAKKVDSQEYRVEVSGGLTEVANLASIARQAIQILTGNSASATAGGPVAAGVPTSAPNEELVIPEDDIPFESNPRIALIKRYAGGKSLKQVFYDAWEAGVVSRLIDPQDADDIELQRIAEWLRNYKRPELSLVDHINRG